MKKKRDELALRRIEKGWASARGQVIDVEEHFPALEVLAKPNAEIAAENAAEDARYWRAHGRPDLADRMREHWGLA